jgi:hypothetical protein
MTDDKSSMTNSQSFQSLKTARHSALAPDALSV